ncbi:MAG: hypothetical protein ACI8TQ_002572 [Planctomycetota bacterium]|jgi:hypothetical protein
MSSSKSDPLRFPELTRRGLLQAGMTGAAAGVIGSTALANAALSKLKTRQIVMVAFAGGVRTRETLGNPSNVPNLAAMAKDGVAYMRTKTANLGHFGATMSLFTGISEARGIRENARGNDPTLFEYVRKGLGLPASDVWISTSGGAQQTNYSYGLHSDYGAQYGANVLDGDGIFNNEFKSLLKSWGRPKQMDEHELDLMHRMRAGIGSSGSDRQADESQVTVERYILQELTRGTSDLRGANAADAKAMRVARNLLTIFKPKLISVVLQSADIAHNSFNAYSEIIRKNDAALGELWQSIKQDPELADSTSIFVLPEFGRDSDLNSRRGLDHGDGSDDLNYVSTVCWGPDFRKGQEISETVRSIDVCATICDMFGVTARFARGKRLPRLMI